MLNETAIPFSFTYGGQSIEYLSHSLSEKNDFQKLKLTLFKNEEFINHWKGNKPIIEQVKGEGKIFGLYSEKEMILSDEVILPADSLLTTGSVKEDS